MTREDLQKLSPSELADKVLSLEKELEESKKDSSMWYSNYTKEIEAHTATKQAIKGLANIL